MAGGQEKTVSDRLQPDTAAGNIITDALHNRSVNILHQIPKNKRDKVLRHQNVKKD